MVDWTVPHHGEWISSWWLCAHDTGGRLGSGSSHLFTNQTYSYQITLFSFWITVALMTWAKALLGSGQLLSRGLRWMVSVRMLGSRMTRHELSMHYYTELPYGCSLKYLFPEEIALHCTVQSSPKPSAQHRLLALGRTFFVVHSAAVPNRICARFRCRWIEESLAFCNSLPTRAIALFQ